jgi:diphthamide synthase (EF-2-diphthine--ammonia ligase)
MVEAGLEAVLIKVAGAGLRERHLGKTLEEMEDELTRLVCPAFHPKQYLKDFRNDKVGF